MVVYAVVTVKLWPQRASLFSRVSHWGTFAQRRCKWDAQLHRASGNGLDLFRILHVCHTITYYWKLKLLWRNARDGAGPAETSLGMVKKEALSAVFYYYPFSIRCDIRPLENVYVRFFWGLHTLTGSFGLQCFPWVQIRPFYPCCKDVFSYILSGWGWGVRGGC